MALKLKYVLKDQRDIETVRERIEQIRLDNSNWKYNGLDEVAEESDRLGRNIDEELYASRGEGKSRVGLCFEWSYDEGAKANLIFRSRSGNRQALEEVAEDFARTMRIRLPEPEKMKKGEEE